MVAILVSEDVQAAVVVKSCWLLSEYVPVAVNCCVFPGNTAGLCGVTAMEVRVTTVKVAPLLPTPLTVTTTGPVVALEGTGTAILVLFQLVGVPAVPLNVIVLVP